MTEDGRGGEPKRPVPLRASCPQCHNPHTIVAEQRQHEVMRFCPMCDHSWLVRHGSREPGVQKRDPASGRR